ncbi:MAG: hypothetical protein A3F72_16085 [Bacteroidetes bacterium RIFCSPLOWO2_12_FULL_35_15]|nr:MAG: hypothetical protein A3F72_16085 [Bacteroidetes bacterium RIFCSPLOWO2_12_FULL_35_15]
MGNAISTMESLSSVMDTLRKRGYKEDFNTNPGKELLQTNPEEFIIDKTYRFEGITDPDDEAILYAISSKKNNFKGILVNGYGIYADESVNKIAERLKIRKT